MFGRTVDTDLSLLWTKYQRFPTLSFTNAWIRCPCATVSRPLEARVLLDARDGRDDDEVEEVEARVLLNARDAKDDDEVEEVACWGFQFLATQNRIGSKNNGNRDK